MLIGDGIETPALDTGMQTIFSSVRARCDNYNNSYTSNKQQNLF